MSTSRPTERSCRGAILSPASPNILNQIAPELEDNAEIQIPFARAGIRGSLFDDKLNYFFTPLTGYNGITRTGSGAIIKITDASITLNLIPYARIRMGQFKHPSGEEAMKEPPQQEFVNGTDTTNQLLGERFFDFRRHSTARFQPRRRQPQRLP